MALRPARERAGRHPESGRGWAGRSGNRGPTGALFGPVEPSVHLTTVKESPFADAQTTESVSADAQRATAESAGGTANGAVDPAKVEATIQAIRPAVQADGGDIAFHGIDEYGVVTVELSGACVSCPASTVTLKAGVERILKDRVEGVMSVINLGDDDETVVSL